MYGILRSKSKPLGDAAVSFARDLIRIPSLSLSEGGVAQRVEEEARQLHFDEVSRDEAGNVVGVCYGSRDNPTVLLNSHLDTVDTAGHAGWTHDPYSADIDGGRLFGLGASDCKGGLAAQLYAVELLRRCLLPLSGNLVFAATVAEENGRSVGVRALMEETMKALGLKPDCAVLGEPTNLGLYYGHDGWMEIDIRIEGRDGPAVDESAARIYAHFLDGRHVRGCPLRPESVLAYRPSLEDAPFGRRATVQLDRRLLPRENVNGVLQEARRSAYNALRAVGGSATVAVDVDVVIPEDRQKLYTGRTTGVRRVANAWATDPFAPVMERARGALSAAGCEVRPGKWQLNRLGMGTAGGVLTGKFGIPTVGYGPGEETQAHAPNESVSLENIAEAVYGTAAIVHALVGVPVFGWTGDEI